MNNGMESVKKSEYLTYSAAGVDTAAADAGLGTLLQWVNKTLGFRSVVGKAMLDIGYFANVVDIGNGLGMAISTDTAGSKVIVAQMLGKYDTIGIDCMAMNVNDVLSVGAEPIAFVDCISIEVANPDMLGEIGKGLYTGAKQAHVGIVGGEIAQVRDMVKGYKPGVGFDLAGTCIGIVHLDQIIVGDSIKQDDAVIGLRSSGIHSNGLTLARKALIDSSRYAIDQFVPELNRTLGEELLEPTRIYVDEITALQSNGVKAKALVHITSDGFLNLTRVKADVGYVLEQLPEPQPIFHVIQEAGNVTDEEMFQVYNMGIGFCVVVDPADADKAIQVIRSCGTDAYRLGYTVSDVERRVRIEPYGLVGVGREFHRDL